MIGQLVCLWLVLHNGNNNTIQLKSLQTAVSISPPVPPGSRYIALFGACFSEKSKRPVFFGSGKRHTSAKIEKPALTNPAIKLQPKLVKQEVFRIALKLVNEGQAFKAYK